MNDKMPSDIKRLELSDKEFQEVKILIVEDNTVCERFYKSLLMDYGFQVETALNGKKALDKVKKDNFDMILMDIMMPEMNGYETADSIRELPSPKNSTPIIAITSLPNIDKNKMINMDHLITKPFNHIQLIRAIDRVLSTKAGGEKITIGETKSEVNEETDFKHVNLKNIKKMSGGKPDFILDMIDMFINQTQEGLVALKPALKNEEWRQVRQIVHKMIMSLHIMGIQEMEKLAIQIEKNIDHEENMKDVPKMTQKLISTGNEVILELKLYRDKLIEEVK
jgi:CheY-like chemotaxis protein/HPt (histidine-containing phosphotransfer) domain-containing protein